MQRRAWLIAMFCISPTVACGFNPNSDDGGNIGTVAMDTSGVGGATAEFGGSGGAGGAPGPDAQIATGGRGGVNSTSGTKASDAPIATGGSGGVNSTGGTNAPDAPIVTGGSGGAPGMGGVPASGGAVGAGGTVTIDGSGGITSSGGNTGTGECGQAQKKCSGNTLLTCDASGNWPTTGTTCPYVCQNNACTGVCSLSDHMCSGDTLLTCNANGNWPATGTTCPHVCQNNACTGVCSPSDHMCSGNTLLTCNANGNWPATGTTCPYVCQNNACTGQCSPTQFQCSGQIPEVCDAHGNWQSQAACANGNTCSVARKGCACSLTLCSDGSCLDTTADPMNCGACDRACPGSCSGGVCACVKQSASNLVTNGGFDSSTSSWLAPSVTLSWSSMDSASCSSSGSLLLTDTTTALGGFTGMGVSGCIPVSDSTVYDIGGWGYMPTQSPQPEGFVFQIEWFLDTACQQNAGSTAPGSTDIPFVGFDLMGPPYDTWQHQHKESVTPLPGTHAALWQLAVARASTGAGLAQKAYFDSLYIAPSPGHF